MNSNQSEIAEQSKASDLYKILMVEDDDFDQKIVKRYLGNAETEYEIDCVTSAEDAKIQVTKHTYDCVLLDFSLPGKTGLSFVREFLCGDKAPPFPIVMLSNINDEFVVEESLNSGVFEYVKKDFFEYETLEAKINNAVSRHKMTTKTD